MTKESLAAMLNGRQYGEEITDAEELEAKRNRLLVIFGASDDIVELRGVANDESYDAVLYITNNGTVLPRIEDEDRDTLRRYGVLAIAENNQEQAIRIASMWCDSSSDYDWSFRTDAPHATFAILEDGRRFCLGIVIDLKELP